MAFPDDAPVVDTSDPEALRAFVASLDDPTPTQIAVIARARREVAEAHAQAKSRGAGADDVE